MCISNKNIWHFKSHKNRKHNPHRLLDFKAGFVKFAAQFVSTDDLQTYADIDQSLSDTDSDIDDSEDLPEILETRLASVLLKLENIFYVPSTAVDELESYEKSYTTCRVQYLCQ